MSKVNTKAVKNFDDFRAAHDKNFIVPKKIKDALAKMAEASGPASWEYEVEFIKDAGVSTTDINLFRSEFSDFVVEVGGRNPKRIWAATKAAATKMREVA